MATIQRQGFEAAMQETGSNPFTLTLKEAALQTFVKGELVVIASGYVEEIASDTPGTIYGVAATPAHNDAVAGTHEVAIELATPSELFRGNVVGAALAAHVLVQSDLGVDMAIIRDTVNNKTFLNSAVSGGGANVRVRTHKQSRGSVVGDTDAQVLFNFKPNWIQFLGTS